MRLLLDSCVWGKACERLRAEGHDVIWVGDSTEDPGDEKLLAQANTEQRVLITLDKDFAELAIVHGFPHAGIVRLVDFPAHRQAEICRYVLSHYALELRSGAIVTATPGRIRVRPAAGDEPDIETGP